MVQDHVDLPEPCRVLARDIAASADLTARFGKDYSKPAFHLPVTTIDGCAVSVTEEKALEKPYGTLLHFRRDTPRNDPPVLIVAPMSGHYATLLRGTVEALLPDHDVYITDWRDARHVPKSQGTFGLEDYISYVRDFVTHLGPDTNVIAVCQPTVPVLAAVSLMAAEDDPCQPATLTLMGGPVDTRAAETAVTRFALQHDLNWFRNNVITQVPPWYAGAGQDVYPGFLQLTGFMAMNPDRHINAHTDLFDHLRRGDGEKADKIKEFYDEYLAVCDLSAPFYLDTIDQVFQRQTLAKGEMTWRGRPVDPCAIRKTALLTVEGALDDIAAPGQTSAAHGLCTGLTPEKHYHHLQPGVGHYGVFNGRHWRDEISMKIKGLIRNIAAGSGITYDPPVIKETLRSQNLPLPALWAFSTAQPSDPTLQSSTKTRRNPGFSGPKRAA